MDVAIDLWSANAFLRVSLQWAERLFMAMQGRLQCPEQSLSRREAHHHPMRDFRRLGRRPYDDSGVEAEIEKQFLERAGHAKEVRVRRRHSLSGDFQSH